MSLGPVWPHSHYKQVWPSSFLNQIWATFICVLKTDVAPCPFHDHATAARSVKSELIFFLPLHHSFSTAYQCIYYSPEHTAKAQEVLSTMSLLQPLITSLADQLLQAAQAHSSSGLRDALKNLSDKVRQPPSHPPILTSNQTISLFPLASSCCNTTYFIFSSYHQIFSGNTTA